MTWQQAQSAAMLAAAQAHADLRVNRREPFVDVVGALAASGVAHLMWRPMGTLFGAYLKQPGVPVGVLVNNGIPFPARRMTLAHELGHHWFGHSTSLDDEHTAGGSGGGRARRWSDREKLAESFAAWFLMPAPAVQAAVRLVTGGPPLSTPEQAYQLSLLMGVPYRTLVRQLQTVRQVSSQTARAWAAVQPGRLKARAVAGFPAQASGRADVFVVAPTYDQVTLVVKQGDRVLFDARPAPAPASGVGASQGWPQWLVPVVGSGEGTSVAFDVLASSPDSGSARECEIEVEADPELKLVTLTMASGGTVQVRVASRPRGLEQGRSLG
ncbi:ImmA/IrrE family metallo-endopeptidase [Humibacillus xanthopallidus]|uniref:Uncharacterized protein DUF955 n=1 Tax=Humibacillus xanthopallidus TaxID=412689 RepID=A0A543HHQ0_9MICO|nr:ImmA/IrrE family metallo-endopeptidase [Humibacillus xanthopallidus]TQM57851.1 uncharacterized protein DUF955 [Humibacillus xanthopallidus]